MIAQTAEVPQTPMEVMQKITESFETATKKFDTLKFDAEVPESVRSMAESTVTQTREAYERSKEALDESIDVLERSFDAVGRRATAFNRKPIDIAQRNLNSSFDYAESLAGAKTFAEIVELQSTYIRNQFGMFAGQATEIQALSKKIATDTSELLKDQMTKSFEAVRKTA